MRNTEIPDIERYYAKAEAKKDWSQGDFLQVLNLIKEEYKRDSKSKILEIGCGMADILDYLPAGVDYSGIDPTEKCIESLKKERPDGNFFIGFAEKLPFENNSYDLVFSTQVLEHVYDPQKSLEEMVRVLKPGGRLIIITPNLETPWSTIVAVRHYGFLKKAIFQASRFMDLALRIIGILTFRTIKENFTEATGRYEKSDDDLKYVCSAYEIATFLKRRGLKIIFSRNLDSESVIKKLFTKFTVLKYAGRGIFFIFQK